MGDPKFPRRLYQTPFHPWKADRILEENAIVHKFGLKNKKEVWRAKSYLRAIRGQARELQARNRTGDPQALKETRLLMAKLGRLGLLSETSTLDDVLTLNLEQVLGRRLQTQVYLKGYTGSIKQARQFIAHGHVAVGGSRMNVPGYYLKRGEEDIIKISEGSSVQDDAHPARPKRVEGAGPPKLKEYKPRVVERGGPGGRGGPGRGGPGGPGRGPPRFGGGFGRGPPPGRTAPAPEPGTAATAAPAPETPREREERQKRKSNEPRIQGGGAF